MVKVKVFCLGHRCRSIRFPAATVRTGRRVLPKALRPARLLMPAAEAAMAKANAQSNKRVCGCVLRGDPKVLGRTPRKHLGRISLRKNYLWQIADTTTRNGMVIVACRVRKTGEMSRKVPRRAVRRTILRVVENVSGFSCFGCHDKQYCSCRCASCLATEAMPRLSISSLSTSRLSVSLLLTSILNGP